MNKWTDVSNNCKFWDFNLQCIHPVLAFEGTEINFILYFSQIKRNSRTIHSHLKSMNSNINYENNVYIIYTIDRHRYCEVTGRAGHLHTGLVRQGRDRGGNLSIPSALPQAQSAVLRPAENSGLRIRSTLICSFTQIAQIRAGNWLICSLLKKLWLKSYFWGVFCYKINTSNLLIPSFLMSDVSASLRSLTKNEPCERIAQVAHQKWATMSNLLRSLMKNEWMSNSLKKLWLKSYFLVRFLYVKKTRAICSFPLF